MKSKFIILCLFTIAFKLNAMEHQPAKEFASEITHTSVWDSLPKELKVEIISYAATPKSLGDLVNKLKNIKGVSTEFKELVKKVINEFARKYVEEHGKEAKEELLKAIQIGQEPIALLLINAGIDVNSRYTEGGDSYTLLHRAIFPFPSKPSVKIIQALIGKGVDVNSQSGWDHITPLMLAVNGRDIEIVKLLIKAKADINAQTGWRKMSALMDAIEAPHIDKQKEEMVKLLIDAGANVNAKDIHGESVLRIAQNNVGTRVSDNKKIGEEIVKLLIDAGAHG